MKEKILNRGVLEVAIDDIQSMSHDDYALARKNFFGASDSSILCGVNLYKTLDELIKEKNNKFITDEERAVGEKPIVRKGYDLEDIILKKAQDELGIEIAKPQDMFKFKNVVGLSVNYDGVGEEEGNLIPIEAKLVSKYGEKYYNKNIRIEDIKGSPLGSNCTEIDIHVKRKAARLGIPAYYYTQVQQEIAGLDAPYGYLAALFDETWTFHLYYIPRDEYTIEAIYSACKANIVNIKRDTQ